MNTVHSSTAESVTSISEASIRTHLTSINRKLASLGLPEIPINTADWILHQDDRYIHADSIGSYITELSLAIDAENDHREKERTLLEAELTSIAKQLRTLREKYKHGGYKQNHEMMNALLQDLRKRWEKSPKIKDLRAQLAPLEKIDKEGNMLQISIDACDTHLSWIKIRLQKSLQKIPDTFIDEIEKNLKKIRIKQMKVIHIEEPEKQKSKKKPTFGLSRKTAAAAVIILGASIIWYTIMSEKEQKKPTPWGMAKKSPTYPPYPRPWTKIVVIKPPVNSIQWKIVVPRQSEKSDNAERDMSTGIWKKIVGVTGKNLADQINTKFTNFINDPRNLEKNICRLYLDNIIASLGRDIQQSTRSIKSTKFIGSKSEKIDNKLIFTISYCSLVDSHGDLMVENSSTRFDITNRFPKPDWIEKDLFQDLEKKKNFETQLLEQCKIRFPIDNIFGLDIRGAEITRQINDPGGISHITLAFMTNLWPIFLEQRTNYKEETTH